MLSNKENRKSKVLVFFVFIITKLKYFVYLTSLLNLKCE